MIAKRIFLSIFLLAAALVFVLPSTSLAAGMLLSDGSKEPVVLVHGYSGSVLGELSVEGYWVFIGGRLEMDGYDTYRIALGNAALQDIRVSAEELRDFVSGVLSDTGKSKVDIVCHSEGGLVAKYYIKYLGGAPYVDDLVTIATPHRGTSVAHIGPGEAARQMEIYSPFLRRMNSEWDFPGSVDYTAIHSNHDEMVFPQANGFFRGAVNMNVNLVGHAGIMLDEFVYRMVRGAVSTDIAGGHRDVPIEIVKTGMTTNNPNVTLKLKKCDHYHTGAEMEEMKISNNQFLHGADFETFSNTKSWRLDTTMDGLKAVYVRFRRGGDLLDLEMQKRSPVYVDYIFYDSHAPSASVEAVSDVTLDSTVGFRVSASDNSDKFKEFEVWNAAFAYGIEDLGVKEMMVSTSPDFHGASWQPYSTYASVDTGTSPGLKTIYLKVRDGAGNESSSVSDTIRVLDPDDTSVGMLSEGDRDPVVLVHGYGGSIAGDVSSYINWIYIYEKLESEGIDARRISLSNAALQDVRVSAQELKSFVDDVLSDTGAAKVDIVCHSEGGLVARYYVKSLGGSAFVDDLVTISTPHRGTTVAQIGPGMASRQMEVGNPFLRELDSGDPLPGNVEYTALFSHADEIVLPGKNGFFDGAVNINYTTFGHAGILFHPAPYEAVKNSLVNRYVFKGGTRPVEIAEPGKSTSSSSITVNIKACNHYSPQSPVKEMMVATNGLFHGASWQPLKDAVNIDIGDRGDGLLGVHVKFRSGNGVESPSYADYIMVDRTQPEASIEITDVDEKNSRIVVSLEASDNTDVYAGINPLNLLESYGIYGIGVVEMRVGIDDGFHSSAWIPFSENTTIPYDTSEAGRKTVYMQVRDAAGNKTGVKSASTYIFDKVNGYMAMEEERDPVVFVHGYSGSIAGDISSYLNWVYYVERLKKEGYSTHVISLGNAALQDITVSARELKEFVAQVLSETGAGKVDVVCHSEGGLVARYYVKYLAGASVVDDLVTIATPHRGTVIAEIGLGKAARQMEVANDFLDRLNSGDPTPGVVDYTSIFSNNDEMVAPPQNGFYQGAININTNIYEHATILFNDEVFRAVKGALDLDVGHETYELPVWIEKDDMFTSSRNVTVNMNYYNHNSPMHPAAQMKISSDKFMQDASWIATTSQAVWTLPGDDGLKAVYVKFRPGESGSESPVYVDYIVLDTTPPEGSVAASLSEDGTAAVLDISATDNSAELGRFNPFKPLKSFGIPGAGDIEMKIWSTPGFEGAMWQEAVDSITWRLPEGCEKVFVKFRDAAGNESEVYSADVIGSATPSASKEPASGDTVAAETGDSDYTAVLKYHRGWNLVHVPESVPRRVSEIIHNTVNSLEGLFDLSDMPDAGRNRISVPGSGRTMWLHLDEDFTRSLNFRAAARPAGDFTILIQEGWNAIGTPGFRKIDVSDVTLTYGGQTVPFNSSTVTSFLDTGFLYYGNNGYLTAEVLEPFHAYFVRAHRPCVLKIPR